MIENGDYKFRDDLTTLNSKDTVPIEVLMGPYEGVVFRYTQVSVKEQENGTATLRFQYDLLEKKDFTEVQLRNDKRFEQHLGILLNHLILQSSEAPENESGEDDTMESSDE